MKNIHVLPTDKPSRLHSYKGMLNLAASEFVAPTIVKNDLINQNIYITNDEENKEGDLIIYKNGDEYYFAEYRLGYYDRYELCRKIILTTDTDLIQDDVQAIDDEFLEWFVKNPSYEEVEVETYFKKIGVETDANGYRLLDVLGKYYKIIIPKEIR